MATPAGPGAAICRYITVYLVIEFMKVNHGKLFATALVVFGLSACASVAKRELPELSASSWQAPLPDTITVGESRDIAQWWQQFNDPLLNELIKCMQHNNPDLATAQINREIAKVQADVAGRSFWPSVGVGITTGRDRVHGEATDTTYSAGVSASWELDLWGSSRALKGSGLASLAQANAELTDAHISLCAEVANAYIALRVAQAQLQVARANATLQQHSYDIARWENQSGLGTQLAQAQAQTLLLQTQAQQPEYENAIAQSINQLRLLLGGTLGELEVQLRQVQPLPAPPSELVIALPAEVLRQRADVRAEEYAVERSSQALIIARNQRLPALNLSGAIAGQNSAWADLFDVETWVQSLGASLSYLLFDGGTLQANEQTARLQLEQALLAYRAALLIAQQETENALSDLTRAQKQRDAYSTAVQSAQLAEQLARIEYDSGLLDFSELLTVQANLLSAQVNFTQNQGEQLSAWVQLYRNLGGGWSSADEIQL